VRQLSNIFHLGIKELRSLQHDGMMLFLIVFAFSISVYIVAKGAPDTLQNAPIAIVDEDRSELSSRITDAFYPPYFVQPELVSSAEADRGLDVGQYTFVLDLPPEFQKDVAGKRNPEIQLNVDATRMSQAFSGTAYVQEIVQGQAWEFINRSRTPPPLPVELEMRTRFNPNLTQSWFAGVMELINQITMLSIILTGAALIREREHGTVEHLLVMPVTPFEIMLGKIWSMSLVVIVASALSLIVIIEGLLRIPVEGSRLLFMLGTTANMLAMTSLGILLGTVARSMPQLGLLVMLILVPLQALSGALTPRESMPGFVQDIMLLAPTTHFVKIAQAILYRGAGIEAVWPQFLALFAIGTLCFVIALFRFRKTITQMA
jgi:ABC-2 type transport system permease protein